jgi:gliding motility-associated-like protein
VLHVFILDNYKLISFTIFNRAGGKIFSTTDSKRGWDGFMRDQPMDPGSYVYYLEMKHPSGKKITRKGNILLLR